MGKEGLVLGWGADMMVLLGLEEVSFFFTVSHCVFVTGLSISITLEHMLAKWPYS